MKYEGSSLPIHFKRLNRGPLDIDSVFESMEDALKYVKGETSYPGQILTIKDQNEYKIYVINGNNELTIQSNTKVGDISETTSSHPIWTELE